MITNDFRVLPKENTMLQTDIYYRGYRLSQSQVEGEVTMTHIWFRAEHIDTTLGGFHAAKALVDGWLHAR